MGVSCTLRFPADDVARAQRFYEKTFGWRMQHMPEMNYTMVGTAPSDAQGMPTQPGTINGGKGSRKAPLSHPVITINVDDIEAALQKVKSNGGSTVMERTSIGPMGFTATDAGQNRLTHLDERLFPAA